MIDRTVRPLIGLTGRVKPAAAITGFPARMGHVAVDLYVSAYAQAVFAAGGLPVHLPQDVDAVEYAGRLDGLLLSGGADVEPARYGMPAEPELGPVEPDRDHAELDLVERAVADGLPILGICRGLQVLNVWAGGSLHQHLPAHARYDLAPDDAFDEIAVTPTSRLGLMYGRSRRVNSLHHQTVDRVAAGWVVTARSADGTVEALEWPGHDVIAVQWHPELLPGAAADPLFAWLVDRARAATSAAV